MIKYNSYHVRLVNIKEVITNGTLAKLARGELVHYMAEEKIDKVSEIKDFNRLGYKYSIDASSDKNMVFIKK